MTLRELMGPAAREDVEVSGLAYDSRAVGPGTLFFCVPGLRQDGHDHAPDAVRRGAIALVVERELHLDERVPEVLVPSARAAMAEAAVRFHGDPTAELDVVGVTGTNGKTTTCFLVRALLEAAGRPCGLLGTVKSVVGGVEREVARTTPEAIDLQATFREMLDAGDRACAMEVSSHALALHRVDGVCFAVTVFTNLTQDHLDFHSDMEDYFAAKRRLFSMGPGPAVVNADDPYGRRLAAELPAAVTFGIDSEADYRATDLRTGFAGSAFTAVTPDGPLEVRTPLPGRFNVANVLGAMAAVRALGVDSGTIVAALAEAGRVPGRFEPVDEGQDFAVLVDYAHTPDSLDNVLRAASELVAGASDAGAGTAGDASASATAGERGRVVVVFGAGGDRDRGKRPLMGEIAAARADRVIVTSDNPRSEDPEAIVDEIVTGAGPGVERVVDRREAIARAVEGARPGDVVVIAGKGHEQGQELAGGRKVPFDDVTVAREALRAAAVGGRA